MSSDDDILFETAVLPEAGGGVAVTSRVDPAGVRHYADRKRVLEALRPGGDFLTSHEELLGRGVACCARAARGDVLALDDLGRDLALRLTAHPHRVLVTAAGLLGDSGFRSSSPLDLRGESWQLATASGDAYETARASREVVRLVPRPTIGECGHLAGHHFGLDNRELLPPFFPAGRREDGIFALTLRVTHPQALCGHLPVAVLHDPVPSRPAPSRARRRRRSRSSPTCSRC